jgi:hypothetical protein
MAVGMVRLDGEGASPTTMEVRAQASDAGTAGLDDLAEELEHHGLVSSAIQVRR